MPRFLSSIAPLFRQPNFVGLMGSTFALGAAFSFVSPFLSTWGTEEVGLTPPQFGLFMTSTSLSAMAISMVLARLSDTRFSRRSMLLLGSAAGAVGYVGYAFVRDPLWLVLIGAVFLGVGSVCFAQLFAHVRETFHLESPTGARSGFLMSVIRVCFSFAWTAGPAIGSLALIRYGFQGLFVGAAALYFVFFLGVARFVPKRDPASRPLAQTRQSVWRELRRPDLLSCFVAFVAVFAAHAINGMNLPLALVSEIGGRKSDFGIVFGVGPLVEIPLMLWFGHLASRGHELRLIRIGAVVTCGYFVCLHFATTPWHVYLIQILSGVSFAILTNVAIVFFQDLIPGQAGLATALFSNAGAVGNLIGLLSFGFIVEAIGHRGAFLACSALAVVTSILVLRYRGGAAPNPSPAAAGSESKNT